MELAYPEHWEADVVTADGGTVHVRPIRPDDGPLIEAFHARQSAESIYFRYFSPRPRLSATEIERLTHVDYVDRMAFVAVLGDELLGVARYDRWRDRNEAEVAFFTDDAQKGRGLATILLEYLAAAAREVGIPTFVASVLPSNRRMISVFRQVGFEVASRFADGVIEVRLDIEPTPEAVAAMEARARLSEARSVARLLAPSTVAVIGAGRERGTIGHEVFRRLIEHEFAGPVYPVNRDAPHVASVRAYPSVLDVPDQVDLAVVAVPADRVREVVEECARARVGGLVVMSAGFAETGADGAKAERELVEVVRQHGVRMLGPASLGIVNTAPSVRLHATSSDVDPLPGRVAVSSQSGTLGAAILDRAKAVGLGVSSMVSVGNKADVSANDLLRYWETDDRTGVVLLYLESFGNPRRFGRIATEVSRVKPIVAVKAGRDPRSDALLAQTGVLRVDTLDHLLDVARVLACQPTPRGRRVAIVSNSAGPANLGADACRGAGLEPTTVVDLTHRAGPSEYESALRSALADDEIDAVLVAYAPPVAARTAEVARAVGAAVSSTPGKPVVASFFAEGAPATFGDIPNFTFPDVAAYALGRAAAYGLWRDEAEGVPLEVDGDLGPIQALVADVLAADAEGRWLGPEETIAVTGATGFEVLELRLVGSADEAVAAAGVLGYPVVLKATGKLRLAKTEAGGIALDLHEPEAVRHAYERMAAALREGMQPAIVQRMGASGRDLRIRVAQDDVVGTVVAIGPGGAAAQRISDEAVRIVPLTDVTARRLLDESPSADRLDEADRAAVERLLARLAWLADGVPDLAEVELNPVIVGGGSALVADARVRVAPWRVEQPSPVRRL